MKEDLTHYFLVNPLWFISGLLIYYIITLFKVHLIWYIQPKIYNHNQENLFKNYFSGFFQTLLSKKKIFRPAFQYLFKYKEKDFLITGSADAKPIKKRLNILDGFTTFLKPYLIFSLIWVILEFWISKKLFYNDTKIALGEIQTLLNFISKLSFVSFLQKNKILVLLAYGILCVLIPFLYDKENTTKKYKTYFTQSLVYLSLIANISFFGIQTGKVATGKAKELAELQTKIISIHDSIYKELAVAIAYNDFKDTLRYENNLYNNEARRFDNLIKSANDFKIDSVIKEELLKELVKHLSEIKDNSVVENSEPAKDEFHSDETNFKSTSKAYTDYFETNWKNNKEYTNYASYMGNPTAWNKTTGEEILNDVKNVFKDNVSSTTVFEKKLEKILGHLFDFGIETSLTEIFSNLGISTHKTLKKVVTIIFSENYKKSLVERTIKILSYFKNDAKKSKEIITEGISPYQVDGNEITVFQKANDDFFDSKRLIAENKELEENIRNKVNSLDIIIPEKNEIVNRLTYSAANDGFSINDEQDALDYVNQKGFKCTDFDESIKNQEREEYSKLLLTYENPSNLKEYNGFLQKSYAQIAAQTSNETLKKAINITKFIGMCNGSGATICIRCGLPCAFPVCLARGL